MRVGDSPLRQGLFQRHAIPDPYCKNPSRAWILADPNAWTLAVRVWDCVPLEQPLPQCTSYPSARRTNASGPTRCEVRGKTRRGPSPVCSSSRFSRTNCARTSSAASALPPSTRQSLSLFYPRPEPLSATSCRQSGNSSRWQRGASESTASPQAKQSNGSGSRARLASSVTHASHSWNSRAAAGRSPRSADSLRDLTRMYISIDESLSR